MKKKYTYFKKDSKNKKREKNKSNRKAWRVIDCAR